MKAPPPPLKLKMDCKLINSILDSKASEKIISHTHTHMTQVQCDLIGQFLKFLGDKFDYKSSPKWLLTFGLFWNRSINVKTVGDIFLQLLETIGQLFYLSISSHWHTTYPSARGISIHSFFEVGRANKTYFWAIKFVFEIFKLSKLSQTTCHRLQSILWANPGLFFLFWRIYIYIYMQ